MQCCVFISGNESGTESDLTWIHPFRDRDRMPSALVHHSIVHQSIHGYDTIPIPLHHACTFFIKLLFFYILSPAYQAAARSLGVAGSLHHLSNLQEENGIISIPDTTLHPPGNPKPIGLYSPNRLLCLPVLALFLYILSNQPQSILLLWWL